MEGPVVGNRGSGKDERGQRLGKLGSNGQDLARELNSQVQDSSENTLTRTKCLLPRTCIRQKHTRVGWQEPRVESLRSL